MMFQMHKCRYVKGKEIEVYNTKEVQKLYEDVNRASKEAYFRKQLKYDDRKIFRHHDSFSMQLSKNAFSLFLVPVVIGQNTYQFIVDTGAQISGVSSRLKELINQSEKGKSIMIRSAAGNKKEMPSIIVERMFLGTVEIEKQPAVILDEKDFTFRFMKKEFVSFDGIIGWDILSHLDFELDAIHHIFSVLESKECFTYCNLISTGFPMVIVYDENRVPALFGIDIGAKLSWVSESYATKKQMKMISEKRGINIGVHGLEKMKVKIMKQCIVRFSESCISLENIRTGQTQVFDDYSLDGIFGNEIFKGRKIQFLNSKGIVRIVDK